MPWSVTDLHERGFEVTGWPVPDGHVLATAVELAADGITTAHPDVLCTQARSGS